MSTITELGREVLERYKAEKDMEEVLDMMERACDHGVRHMFSLAFPEEEPPMALLSIMPILITSLIKDNPNDFPAEAGVVFEALATRKAVKFAQDIVENTQQVLEEVTRGSRLAAQAQGKEGEGTP